MSGPQLEPDLFAVATMLHALANTYGPCHSCPITVGLPFERRIEVDQPSLLDGLAEVIELRPRTGVS